jgi:predicted nucleic acid-binding protein
VIIYADTSAVLKLVVEEQESSTLAEYLSTASRTHRLVASMLLYTELHCAARRRAIHGELVNAALGGINLVDLVRSDLMYAAALPGRLRSADAIHLAVAIRLQVDVLVSYDVELLAAAVEAGLNVLSPGKRTGRNEDSVHPSQT